MKEGLTPDFDRKGKTYKAIEGAVFGSDTWRSNALMLLAIAHSGDVAVASDPNEMMRVANAYALAGLPRVIGILGERGGEAALDYLPTLSRKPAAHTPPLPSRAMIDPKSGGVWTGFFDQTDEP